MNELTTLESQQLEAYEQVIARGLKTFVEVGEALQAIRDSGLYKEYGTFENYCQERWGIARQHAYRMIDAAEVVANLSPIGDILPATESQTRPLAKLEPEQQRQVWQAAVASAPNGKVTAAHVEKTKQQVVYGDYDDGWEDYGDDESANEVPIIKHSVNSHNILHSSETNEWYTPAEYALAVHQVMGDIDLDPASCDFANETIGAREYFTIDDDGLTKEWRGRIYLNPPYGKTRGESNQGIWADALVWSYEEGDVTEAILLVNAVPGNKWFAPLWNYPICFVDHRIKFYNATEEKDDPTHSSCFVYLGENRDKFAQVFGNFGVVAVRYESV